MLGSFEQLGSCWWWLVLLGLATGALGGTFGVGGGILVVPALVILFAVPQKSAQATSLAVMIPMALLSLYLYCHNAEIKFNLPAAAIIAAGALAGAVFGTQVVRYAPSDWLRKAFAVFLVIVAVQMFLKGSPESPPAPGSNPSAAATQPQQKGHPHE